jgi:hypothetical protein
MINAWTKPALAHSRQRLGARQLYKTHDAHNHDERGAPCASENVWIISGKPFHCNFTRSIGATNRPFPESTLKAKSYLPASLQNQFYKDTSLLIKHSESS